jgi:hypothetical protein
MAKSSLAGIPRHPLAKRDQQERRPFVPQRGLLQKKLNKPRASSSSGLTTDDRGAADNISVLLEQQNQQLADAKALEALERARDRATAPLPPCPPEPEHDRQADTMDPTGILADDDDDLAPEVDIAKPGELLPTQLMAPLQISRPKGFLLWQRTITTSVFSR